MLARITAGLRGVTADGTRLTADRTLLQVDPPPARLGRADGVLPGADALAPTVDADSTGGVPTGWPCARLSATPPSVLDAQAQPTPESLLPAVLALTPRGPAWGTDEAGDGRGASPVMRQVWTALAAWVAAQNRAEWGLATQALPSAVTDALADWEAELGLPDPCGGGDGSQEGRRNAVRARFAAQGGCSPAYFVCLASALGYDIWIEEPTQFLLDTSEVVGDSLVETWFRIDEGMLDETPIEGFELTPSAEDADEVGLDPFVDTDFRIDEGTLDTTPIEGFASTPGAHAWEYWIVHVRSLGETWFTIDEGRIDTDPLEGFVTADALECLIRRLAPAHTTPIFSYAAAA